MANQKISQMPSLTASELAAGDLLAVVDVSDVTQASSGSNKKITVTELQSAAVSAGTANGILYLSGSKQATSGSALTFDGSAFWVAASSSSSDSLNANGFRFGSGTFKQQFSEGFDFQQYYTAAGQAWPDASVSVGSGYYALNISGSEQMRLTSTGLGIGTSSPASKLNVQADDTNTIARQITISGATSSNKRLYLGFNTSTNVGTIQAYEEGFGKRDLVLQPDSGNLGLGVTPSGWGSLYKAFTQSSVNTSTYSFWDGAHPIIGMANGGFVNAAYSWEYTVSGRAVSRYAQEGDGAHKWYTAPSGTAGEAISFTQVMDLVHSAGASTLTVNSTINTASAIQLTTNGGLNAGMFLANPTVDHSLGFQTAGSERARIDSAGNLMVGTTTSNGIFTGSEVNTGCVIEGAGGAFARQRNNDAPVYLSKASGYTNGNMILLYVAGSAVGSISVTDSATSYNTSSDYRLKNITGPVQNSGAYIDSLNPVEGTWKADGSTFVGLIAHEVQEASRTQVATGEKDGEQMQAMDYSNSELIANLIAEVQALRKRVAQLESSN